MGPLKLIPVDELRSCLKALREHMSVFAIHVEILDRGATGKDAERSVKALDRSMEYAKAAFERIDALLEKADASTSAR
jgi:hypothetical protein